MSVQQCGVTSAVRLIDTGSGNAAAIQAGGQLAVDVVPLADSVAAGGTAAAPGAGVSFVGTSNPVAGVYQVVGGFVITGAVEASPLNVALVLNNATFCTYPTSGGVTDYITFQVPRFTHAGGTAPFLKAVAAATAATVYTGWLEVTRIQ